MTHSVNLPLELVRRGDVDELAVEYATKRVGSVMELVSGPILFVRVRLSRDADPHRVRPSLAQVTLDVNGDVIRAQVAADTMTEAIDLLVDRLRNQIQHRAERRRGGGPREHGRVALERGDVDPGERPQHR